MTHTYAFLEVSAAAYDEIAAKLHYADHGYCFNDNGEIDMRGIALVRKGPSDGEIYRDKSEQLARETAEACGERFIPTYELLGKLSKDAEVIYRIQLELPYHTDFRSTFRAARTLDLTCDCGQINCCWPRYDNCGND